MRDILRMFSDKTFRAGIARSLKNPAVKNFLEKEFNQYSFGYRADGVASIQNKVGAFLADPLLNRILTTSKSEIHVRKIMDEGKILLVNLAKGRLGEDSSSLLGGLLVTTIGLAAYSRADVDENQREGFFAYVDEFQSFTTMALAKHALRIAQVPRRFTIAHQYLHQLDSDIQHAVLGNAGTIISFRVGAEDAPYLAREFAGQFDEIDLVQLPNYRIYLKLMIDRFAVATVQWYNTCVHPTQAQ